MCIPLQNKKRQMQLCLERLPNPQGTHIQLSDRTIDFLHKNFFFHKFSTGKVVYYEFYDTGIDLQYLMTMPTSKTVTNKKLIFLEKNLERKSSNQQLIFTQSITRTCFFPGQVLFLFFLVQSFAIY